MAGKIDARLKEKGITLPVNSMPQANYVPWVVSGKLVFISGQVPWDNGRIAFTGKVGADVDLPTAQTAARVCALNVVAQLRDACGGDLDRVVRCVKVGGFVNCVDGYGNQPEVVNGASDLLVEVFGDAGRHARFAVGANALPRNVPVEVEAVFEIA